MSCVVRGQPRPRVVWYKEGKVIDLTDISGRIEARKAGSRHVLLIQNIQDSDYGSYMCYSTNSMGSAQVLLEVKEEDKDNKSAKKEKQGGDRNYKMLNRNLQKDRKALIKFKLRMEKEIEWIKTELNLKKDGMRNVKIEDSFEKAILSDLGNVLVKDN